jgi:hypothetical protein
MFRSFWIRCGRNGWYTNERTYGTIVCQLNEVNGSNDFIHSFSTQNLCQVSWDSLTGINIAIFFRKPIRLVKYCQIYTDFN